jgi:hypothetical protein
VTSAPGALAVAPSVPPRVAREEPDVGEAGTAWPGSAAKAPTIHPRPAAGDSQAKHEAGAATPFGPSERVYNQTRGKNGQAVVRSGLCVEAVTDQRGRPTLKFEAAGVHPEHANRCAWENKVMFFAEPDEVQLVLCVLLGYLDTTAFANHGPRNNKYLNLRRQPDSFYLTMGEGKDRSVAIKIPPGSAARIALLALRQFQIASFDLDISALHLVLSRVTAPLAKAAADRAPA